MINETRQLNPPSANGNSTGVDVSQYGEKTVHCWASAGSYSASVQVQLSNLASQTPPGAADPSWLNEGSPLAAAGSLHILKRARWMRLVVSSYVSGTLAGAVVGDYAHEADGRKVSG